MQEVLGFIAFSAAPSFAYKPETRDGSGRPRDTQSSAEETRALPEDTYVPAADSQEARAVYDFPNRTRNPQQADGEGKQENSATRDTNAHTLATRDTLDTDERAKVEELKRIDAHVRVHEQAHVAAGAHSPSYIYVMGPDGKNYAVGGNAKVPSVPPSDDPSAKLIYAQKVRSAALAPSDPSPADRSIAVDAERMELEAQQELMQAANSDDQLATMAPQGRSSTTAFPEEKASQQDVSLDRQQMSDERLSYASASRVLLNRIYQANENRNTALSLISLTA